MKKTYVGERPMQQLTLFRKFTRGAGGRRCFVVAAIAVLLCAPRPSRAEGGCDKMFRDVPGKSALGSASTWANLRSAEGSLKKESKDLLNDATKKRDEIKAPENACPDGCIADAKPLLVFKSVPNKFLDSYNDSIMCNRLNMQTSAAPFRFPGKSFSSLDDLNSWFSDFSQGKGEEGGELYEKCPGDCSPQYTNIIDMDGSNFKLTAEATCGPARDKNDNQYKLSVAYRFACKPKG